MPYCSAALKVSQPECAIALISQIAIEQFRAVDAYAIDSNMWNIDAGENDVRAIYPDDSGNIKFFCRDDANIRRFEAKIADFASKHPGDCRLVEQEV